MKKLVLAGLLLAGSVNLMATEYVAGFIKCNSSSGGGKSAYFIVKGIGNNLSHNGQQLAMGAFLNAEYASETNSYCEHNQVYTDGVIFDYSSKAKANRKFSELINDYKSESYVSKLVIIKKGYDESDWR